MINRKGQSIWITLAVSTLSTFCYSQNIFREGYFVKESGDTLKGYIKLEGNRNSPSGILFKNESDKSTVTRITNNEIAAAVQTNYRYYKTITVQETKMLSQFLVEGKANLFSWNKEFFLQKENEFYPLLIEETLVDKEKSGQISSGENYIHRKKTYIGTLKSVFNDCSKLQSDIDQSALVETSLTNLVEEYNECIGKKPLVFKKEIPLFQLEISPLIGISYTNLSTSVSDAFYTNFGYFDLMDFNQVTVTPGVGFNFSSPRIDERLSLYLEARYIRNSFNQEVTFSLATYDHNNLSLAYSYLYFPIMIQSDIPVAINKNIFIKLGLLQTINLTSNYKNIQRISSIPTAPERVTEDRFDFYGGQTGFTAGLGFDFRIGGKTVSFIEARVENPGTITNSVTVGLLQNVYSLIYGFSF